MPAKEATRPYGGRWADADASVESEIDVVPLR